MTEWNYAPPPPRPWIVAGTTIKAHDHGKFYAVATVPTRRMSRAGQLAAAHFILRACNAHDNLVAALQLALKALDASPRFAFEDSHSHQVAARIEAILSMVKSDGGEG